MKHTYLHDVLPFLRELEREKQKQFEAYFRTAPLWLMDLFQSEIMEAGTGRYEFLCCQRKSKSHRLPDFRHCL